MSHLSPERLAALVDTEPSASEFAHLIACAVCATELEAHRALVAMAASEHASIGLPLTRWESISASLHKEGLLSTAPAPLAVVHRTRRARVWLQVAAALLFTAGGMALGRFTAGAAPVSTHATAAAAAPARDSIVFQSTDDARAAFSRAEALYQNAASYLAQHDTATRTGESPSAMRTRLAALDRVAHTIREALNDAPYDPVLNGYHLTTLSQREATLRQLNTALPVGLRINTF